MLAARVITDLGLIQERDTFVKLYGLSHTDQPPTVELVEAASTAARRRVSTAADDSGHTTFGFAIAHRARPACFVLIGWWMTDVDLACDYLTSPHEQPHALRPVNGAAIGCLWELDVLAHERAAWWRALASGGSHAAYLTDRLTGRAGPPIAF
jgi:hypothetical protein